MPPTDPEHRVCGLTGRRAVVAPVRGERPMMPADFCPFCPGSEWDTPGEVYAVRPADTAPDSPGWSLRVVPNKFPAVRPFTQGGFGFHEVLIDTPRHLLDPAGLTAAETCAGLVAARERMRALGAQPGVAGVTFFRNVGADAGASLAHTHAQLIAAPFVPETAAAEAELAVRRGPLHRAAGGCATCHALDRPRRLGPVVAETPGFVAACPWAGRFDHEVWLLPKRHAARFEATTDADAAEFAGLLRRVRRAVTAVVGRPAYNEVVRSWPPGEADSPFLHWRLELLPRTATLAGFELGTGCHILTVPPERSAELLRAHLPPEDEP